MVNTVMLRGLIAEKGIRQNVLAKELGCTPKTLRKKLRTGKFNTEEMDKMIDILSINNPTEIFFALKVTQ